MISHIAWCKFRAANLHLKAQAQREVNRALYAGTLTRQPCESCGAESRKHRASDAHHEDYAEPLEVIWLCRRCHSLRHQGWTLERLGIQHAKEIA